MVIALHSFSDDEATIMSDGPTTIKRESSPDVRYNPISLSDTITEDSLETPYATLKTSRTPHQSPPPSSPPSSPAVFKKS